MGSIQHELSRPKVIAHVDLDAFYAQVESTRNPELKGRPVVVVQYNPAGDLRDLEPDANRVLPNANNSIIAVSYEARKYGIKRNMMGQEARKLCNELCIVQVPVAHGKADLTIYRDASAQIVSILSGKGCVCEKASIDEVYLDVTEAAAARLALLPDDHPPLPASFEGMHVEGQACTSQAELPPAATTAAEAWWHRPHQEWLHNERLLAAGAQVVQELRMAVLNQLGYTCSAGVSHYKILAKLGSGLHKPAQQTLVPAAAVARLLGPLPLSKLRGLGGDFGRQVQQATGANTCGDLWAVPVQRLESLFGSKRGVWLSRLAWGIDAGDEVKQRLVPNQISCAKTFRGSRGLCDLDSVRHWMRELAGEVADRCVADRQANQRIPTSLSVGLSEESSTGQATQHTRACSLGRVSSQSMTDAAVQLIKTWATGRSGWRLTCMSLTVSKFVHAPSGTSITSFVTAAPSSPAGRAAARQPAGSMPSNPQHPQPQRQHQAVHSTPSPPPPTAAAQGVHSAGRRMPQPGIRCLLPPPTSCTPLPSLVNTGHQPQQQLQQLQLDTAQPGGARWPQGPATVLPCCGSHGACAHPGQELGNTAKQHEGQQAGAYSPVHQREAGVQQPAWRLTGERADLHEEDLQGGAGQQGDTCQAQEEEQPGASAAGHLSQAASASSQLPASLSDWLYPHSGQSPGPAAAGVCAPSSGQLPCHHAAGAVTRVASDLRVPRPRSPVAREWAGKGSEAKERDSWQHVRGQDVDPEVLQQLPPEVRQELQTQLLVPAFKLSSVAGGSRGPGKRHRQEEQPGPRHRPLLKKEAPSILAFCKPPVR